MGDHSKITVVGYLAGDPEMRYTGEGTARVTFSIPTHRKYNDEEYTTWHRITVWGNSAEACNNWLKKGSVVHVEGRLNPDQETGNPRIWYRDGEDVPNASYEIVARNVTFLSNLREHQRQDAGGAQYDPHVGDDIPW